MISKISTKPTAQRRTPLSRSVAFAIILALAGLHTASANNVPGVVTGELIHKTEKSIFLKNGGKSQIEIGLSSIGSLMVLDGKKFTDGWLGKTAIGGGSGLGLSVIDGNSPKNFKQTMKMGGIGAGLGFVLRVGWNFITRKPPVLIYDSSRPSNTVELIKALPLGSKVRITYKNHH